MLHPRHVSTSSAKISVSQTRATSFSEPVGYSWTPKRLEVLLLEAEEREPLGGFAFLRWCPFHTSLPIFQLEKTSKEPSVFWATVYGRPISIHLRCWEVPPFLTIQRQRYVKFRVLRAQDFYTPLPLNCQKGQHSQDWWCIEISLPA